jgi:ATP-binding cassette subfamily D (ALD) protein 3
LINLAKAIGKLVISYKDIQHLAGYTILVSEVGEVLTDLNRGRYIRKLVNSEEAKVVLAGEEEELNSMDRGKSFETEEHIEFIDLPIITPNNDVLI